MKYPADFTDDLRKKPICGVLAVAVVAGITFAEATEVIKRNLMPWQKRHGGRTYPEQLEASLRELNVNFHVLPIMEKLTLERWITKYCNPGKTYMIATSRHFVTFRDGIVVDQYEINPISVFGARRCFVRQVLEII
jgi:hypothetical protein